MLPIIYNTDIPDNFEKSLRDFDKLTLLSAPTGYGKSVMLVDKLASIRVRSILVIPNRPAVKALYGYTSKLFYDKKIGYAMQNEKIYGFHDVTIMTTGYFLEYITYHKEILDKKVVIAIDEAHEHGWQTDLLIRMLLWKKQYNQNLKVIISSATFNINKFIRNYNCDILRTSDQHSANVKMIFRDKDTTYNAEDIKKIVLRSIGEHILVILPGEEEIHRLMAHLSEDSTLMKYSGIQVKVLYSKLDQEDIDNAINIEDGSWTIILATNIVESAITITGLDIVIDTCQRKINVIENDGSSKLTRTNASKSNIIQSSGRVGREGKWGIAYIMLTQEQYERLDSYDKNEAYRCPLYNQILKLVKGRYPFVDVLSEFDARLDHTVDILIEHGFVTINGNQLELTDLGNLMTRLSLSLKSVGFLYDVLQHVSQKYWYYAIVIASWMNINGGIFYYPRKKFKESIEAYNARIEELTDRQNEFRDKYEDTLTETLGVCMHLNISKEKIPGLYSKNIRMIHKLTYRIINSIKELGYHVKASNQQPSVNNIRSHLIHSLYQYYNDKLVTQKEIDDDRLNIVIDKTDRKPHFDNTINCLALSTFTTHYNKTLLSKLVEIVNPEISRSVLLKLEFKTGILIDIWKKDIISQLELEDIFNLMSTVKFIS